LAIYSMINLLFTTWSTSSLDTRPQVSASLTVLWQVSCFGLYVWCVLYVRGEKEAVEVLQE